METIKVFNDPYGEGFVAVSEYSVSSYSTRHETAKNNTPEEAIRLFIKDNWQHRKEGVFYRVSITATPVLEVTKQSHPEYFI